MLSWCDAINLIIINTLTADSARSPTHFLTDTERTINW